MEPWQWVMLGALVLGAETIIDTEFYLVFVGISAIAVGLNSFAPFRLPLSRPEPSWFRAVSLRESWQANVWWLSRFASRVRAR
jgi:membrane protein implicated in regulation of membrane protease activity